MGWLKTCCQVIVEFAIVEFASKGHRSRKDDARVKLVKYQRSRAERVNSRAMIIMQDLR